jgi:3-phenylpropionate/cinnamic acid dioxygenase small subunit
VVRTTRLISSIRVIRVNSEDEVIARANNLIVGRAAYETAVRLYTKDTIQYRDGARIIARSSRSRVDRVAAEQGQRLEDFKRCHAEIDQAKVEAWLRWFDE